MRVAPERTERWSCATLPTPRRGESRMMDRELLGSEAPAHSATRVIQEELDAFRAELEDYRPARNATPTQVGQALAYIHAHLFDERLNATGVCEACGLHNHNIASLFKRVIGVGMRRYIERQRLTAAKRLLRHETLHVLDIAWSVGYTYPETFERAFHRTTGCTPTEYREGQRSRRNDKTDAEAL